MTVLVPESIRRGVIACLISLDGRERYWSLFSTECYFRYLGVSSILLYCLSFKGSIPIHATSPPSSRCSARNMVCSVVAFISPPLELFVNEGYIV